MSICDKPKVFFEVGLKKVYFEDPQEIDRIFQEKPTLTHIHLFADGFVPLSFQGDPMGVGYEVRRNAGVYRFTYDRRRPNGKGYKLVGFSGTAGAGVLRYFDSKGKKEPNN